MRNEIPLSLSPCPECNEKDYHAETCSMYEVTHEINPHGRGLFSSPIVRVGTSIIVVRDHKVLVGRRKGSHAAGPYILSWRTSRFRRNLA
jgi:hypothetical protein